MNHFTHLQEFIRTTDNWKDVIHHRPYCVRISPCPFNSRWNLLMYNMHHCDFGLDVVRECRGTVVDDDGNIICAPYTKFFNFDDEHADTIDWESAIVREKIDGVLIKMFKYEGKAYWVSNGGWDIWHIDLSGSPYDNAKTMLDTLLNTAGTDWTERIPDGYTLLFEMVSPYSRIICFYEEPKLWFHGIRDNEGNEMMPEAAKELFGIPFDIPQQYPFHSLEEVQAAISSWHSYAQEGVVVCDKNFKRLKIKCEDYLKKKFCNDANTLRQFWRIWADGSFDDLPSGETQWRVSLLAEAANRAIDLMSTLWTNANRLLDACNRDFGTYARQITSDDSSSFHQHLFLSAAKQPLDDFVAAVDADIKQVYAHFVNLMNECGIDMTDVIARKYEPEDESEKGFLKFNKQKTAE